jgi:hypothetical protein
MPLEESNINFQPINTEPTVLVDQVSNTNIYIGTSRSFSDPAKGNWKIKRIWQVGSVWKQGYASGEITANDYMVVRFEIRDLCKAKGWSNMTNVEKDVAIKHYISDNPTDAVIYLMSKGYSQQQAQGFVLMSWHKYHAKLLEACNLRTYYIKFVVPQYVSLTDGEKLFDDAQSLIYEFTQLGRFGIAIGDKKSGILDYIMSTNDYAGAGMAESGLVLTQGTWDIFRNAITTILVDGIYTKYN